MIQRTAKRCGRMASGLLIVVSVLAACGRGGWDHKATASVNAASDLVGGFSDDDRRAYVDGLQRIRRLKQRPGQYTIGDVVYDGHASEQAHQGPNLIRPEYDSEGAYDQGHNRPLFEGHSYPMEEAMTDHSWAQTLMLARRVGNRSGIQTAYDESSYVKFDPPVSCKIASQDSVSPYEPVECAVQSGEHAGETVYATVIGSGR
jgi:hypothetical protein